MPYLCTEHRRVLLIDENVRKRNLRAMVLRNHEVEVHTAAALSELNVAWKAIPYDMVLLAVQENSPEATAATAQIWQSNPRQRVGLLIGPPNFVRELGRPAKGSERLGSRPRPVVAIDEAISPQWREIVQKVVTGWPGGQMAAFGASN